MPFTEEEIESIRADCFANDVAYDLETFADLSEDELIAYFESGGEELPAGVPKPKPLPKPKPKAPLSARDARGSTAFSKASAGALAEPDEAELPEERPKVRGLLCLHAMAHCGQIMQKQLRPLGLEAVEAGLGPMRFVDGALPVDTSIHPEAKRLKAFYPAFANLTYLEVFEKHAKTGAERPFVLKPEDPKERPLNPHTLSPVAVGLLGDAKPATPWSERYRGIEPALQLLARALAASTDPPASNLGVVAFSQGANLLMMLLAIIDAAVVADSVPCSEMAASSAAQRRKARVWPACAVLFGPTTSWMSQFIADPSFCGRALAAIDAGIAQAEGGTDAFPALGEVAVAPPPLEGVFARKLALPALIILGQWDPSFESGKHAGLDVFHRARIALHEEGHKIPQGEGWGTMIKRFLGNEPEK